MDDPKLIKLKDDLRSLMSSELRLIDATIDALQKPETAVSEGDKEILNTALLMYQGLGVSIHSVLRLTEFPDMAIKDCFSIARGIVEASINIAYIISSKPDVAARAQAHALQRFYRDFSKDGTIAGIRISVTSDFSPNIEEVVGLKEALEQFTDKRGQEIRDWCPKTQNEKIEVVQTISKKAAMGLAGAKFAIYRHSSEILHGTYYGTLYFWLSPTTGKVDTEAFYYRWLHNHLTTIFTAIFFGGLGAMEVAAVRFNKTELLDAILHLKSEAKEVVRQLEGKVEE